MNKINEERIRSLADGFGLREVGFCSFGSVRENLISCSGLRRIPENSKGIIVFIFPYLLPDEMYKDIDISRYAVVPDYHNTASEILNGLCEALRGIWTDDVFEPFVDSSPIPEVRAACFAGLGARGKNGLLITEKYGSWVFIGEIVTSLEFQDSASDITPCPDCGRCYRACPGGAIGEDGINKEKCLSHISQKKSELTDGDKQLLRQSGCVWGCDICSLVCPCNKDADTTYIEEFINGASARADSENIEGRAYGWRGKKVLERNIKIIYGDE